jgi:hypothetical protein
MGTSIGENRLYDTLCRVLDSLRAEAPASNAIYNPRPCTPEALILARSRALLHLFLKARFGIVRFAERERFVTDGRFDGGVDAYYIDQKNKFIYILQSKFRATAANFVGKKMDPYDLLKMDVSRILKGENCHENGDPYNEKITKGLQRDIRKLTDVASYTNQVVLLGNSKHFTNAQLKRLVEGFKVEQFPHDRTYHELLLPVINGTYFTDPNLTIEINLANLKRDTHLEYEVKASTLKTNTKLLFVPTREIGRIMHVYKNTILKFNPRSFLELKHNPVNQEIETSIRNTRGNEFALFNNGITIVAESTSISTNTAKQGTAQIILRNPQLVNGAQTAYTLARIYEDCVSSKNFEVFRGKEVLMRVINFLGPVKPQNQDARIRLMGEISKASNSQTKVEESDRRSNDPVQIRIQTEFFEKYGLYYERKRGEFADGLHHGYLLPDQLINRERLVRVSLACSYDVSQLRSGISKFFDEARLASLLKTKDLSKYAYGYEVLQGLDKKRKSKPRTKGDRYYTSQFGQALRYGQYAVVAVCANRGPAKGKKESQALEAALKQWTAFEAWAEAQPSNSAYKSGASFDYVGYYKGATIKGDLQKYSFIF